MSSRNGMLAALGAYTIWGLLPVYWKAIQHVPSLEILCHRMVWSLVFVLLLLAWTRRWQWLERLRQRPAMVLPFVVSAILLSVNWFVYIWAVNSGRIVDASLGYFINPLVSVLLGVVFLREQLRPGQWAAIALAAAGVAYLTWNFGQLPWIALTLAFTFGIYGLIRKTAPLGSLEGFSVEAAVMFVPALLFLLYQEASGTAAFSHDGLSTTLLLAFAGVATAVPLLLFAYGAQRVPLTTLGILQYVAPTLQFLLGVFLYHESFTAARLVGFSLIWTSLLLYWAEGALRRHRQRALVAQPVTSDA
jgi:chloramphenicol-sensitive protein RarD